MGSSRPAHLRRESENVLRQPWTRATLLLAASLAGSWLLAPGAGAAPALCTADTIQQTLISAGKLTQEDVDNGVVVDLVRCGDVTNDRASDAVFTLASGGTAGDTRFGVLKGSADGSSGSLVLYKQGYKVGIARHSSRSFDVLQPHYDSDDPNCCPSSFRMRRYTWTGARFKAGKAKKLKTAPRRFYKP
jgi:hypothetical protein